MSSPATNQKEMERQFKYGTSGSLGQVIDAHTQFGWKASLDLTFIDRGDKTVLKHRSQQGPLAIQRPLYPEGNPCHTYLLHPPGGVVGGDTLQISVHAIQGAKSLITTQERPNFIVRNLNTPSKSRHCMLLAALAWSGYRKRTSFFLMHMFALIPKSIWSVVHSFWLGNALFWAACTK